jgi:hypothetical protein
VLGNTLCMNILDWYLYGSYSVGAQLRILVSLVGWCLYNILVSWCSVEEIGVSSRFIHTRFLVVGWCLQIFMKIIVFCFLP